LLRHQLRTLIDERAAVAEAQEVNKCDSCGDVERRRVWGRDDWNSACEHCLSNGTARSFRGQEVKAFTAAVDKAKQCGVVGAIALRQELEFEAMKRNGWRRWDWLSHDEPDEPYEDGCCDGCGEEFIYEWWQVHDSDDDDSEEEEEEEEEVPLIEWKLVEWENANDCPQHFHLAKPLQVLKEGMVHGTRKCFESMLRNHAQFTRDWAQHEGNCCRHLRLELEDMHFSDDRRYSYSPTSDTFQFSGRNRRSLEVQKEVYEERMQSIEEARLQKVVSEIEQELARLRIYLKLLRTTQVADALGWIRESYVPEYSVEHGARPENILDRQLIFGHSEEDGYCSEDEHYIY